MSDTCSRSIPIMGVRRCSDPSNTTRSMTSSASPDASKPKYFSISAPKEETYKIKYNQPSLASTIEELRELIINKATTYPKQYHKDLKYLEIFRDNFSRVRKQWTDMLDDIIKITQRLDSEYGDIESELHKRGSFFGLRKSIILTITNICISYIVIGNETETKINTFLQKLPITMQLISDKYKIIYNRNNRHNKYLLQQDDLISSLESLKKNGKPCRGKLHDIESSDLEKTKTDMIFKLDIINQNIDMVIQEKNNELKIIVDATTELFGIIDFKFSLHKDWSASLSIEKIDKYIV